MNQIKRIPSKTAFIMAACFYGLTILLHILVLLQVIPYNWISGGRLSSYDVQIPVTIANLLLSVIGLLINNYAKVERDRVYD